MGRREERVRGRIRTEELTRARNEEGEDGSQGGEEGHKYNKNRSQK